MDKQIIAEWLEKWMSNGSYPNTMYEAQLKMLSDFAAEFVPKWVSVEERLPDENQHVLVLRTNPNVVTTGYIHKYGHWMWSNLNGSTHKADHIYKITHWQPLPPPPTK